ncbi:MAG: SRPBCC family protein [Planctomycetota bacterium]|jgi:ligand-binding SRPBCC domain-containing protein
MELFETRIELPCSVEAAFDLAARPEGILQLTPPDVQLAFKQAPERYALGTRVVFQVQAMGLIKEIAHEVTHFNDPSHFIEKQVDGPFQHWIHEHHFEVTSDGTVIAIDRIEFLPPGGIAGMLMNAGKIRENLEDGFEFRHLQLEKLLGSAGG